MVRDTQITRIGITIICAATARDERKREAAKHKYLQVTWAWTPTGLGCFDLSSKRGFTVVFSYRILSKYVKLARNQVLTANIGFLLVSSVYVIVAISKIGEKSWIIIDATTRV